MNFLTKTLGSFTGYNIPYNIGERIQDPISENYASSSIWAVYEGTSKADGSKCTIFEFDLKNSRNTSYVALARNAARKLKSTRIPGVLKVFDTLETDSNIYIFAERVVPLAKYLQNNQKALSADALLLGIYIISKVLKHINVEGSSVHGNVDLLSVFVSDSGEWRLGGFELMTNIKSDSEQAVYRYSSACPTFRNVIPPEVTSKGIEALRGAHNQILKLDSYKLGGLIWCLFNNINSSSEINGPSQFLQVNKIPKTIQPALKKLLQNSTTTRMTVEVFVTQGEKSIFKGNALIDCYKDLDELNLKPDSEKLEFMRSLENIKSVCPPGFMEYRIIPELIRLFNINMQQMNNGLQQQDMNNTATCLYYILSFSENLDEDVFKKSVNLVIIQGFQLPDRTIRVTLLTTLPKYVDKLSKSEVSDKIFSNLLTGFSDTNPTVREETLKAILPISSKLSDRQLNNELLRYLAKLQNDEKPEIRTNTVICLCKIAKNLNSSSRPGVLITAYNKSLKDKFVPARTAALLSFETCIEFFSPDVCCSRVLSSVAPCLLDKSSKVRKEARKVFELYMKKIDEEAERLPAANDENDDFGGQTNENGEFSLSSNSGHQDSLTTNKDAANLTSNIQKLGFSLAMGAFTKMSGIGGQLEPTKNIPTPELSRSTTPSSFFDTNGKAETIKINSKPAASQTNKSSSLWDNTKDVDVDNDAFAEDLDLDDTNDAWGFDIDDEPAKPVAKKLTSLSLNNVTKKKPILSKSKTASLSKGSTASKGGLKLGSAKADNDRTSKLQLNLDIDGDEDDDAWGGGW